MCVCVSVCMYICMCRYPQRPEESVIAPKPGVTGGRESPDMGSRNRIQVLWICMQQALLTSSHFSSSTLDFSTVCGPRVFVVESILASDTFQDALLYPSKGLL